MDTLKSNTTTSINDIISVSVHPALAEAMQRLKPPTNSRLRNPLPRTNGTTDPLKSLADIQLVKDYFLSQAQRYPSNHTSIRNYALFVVGINCARRIGDMLTFKVEDFIDENGQFKKYYRLKEGKTGKPVRLRITDSMCDAVSLYLGTLAVYNLSDFLFQSREGDNQPLTTRAVSKIMKDMSRAVGLEARGINFNCHSMRKTWAYHAYIHDKTQLASIQKVLNHSSQAITLHYIGIDQEEMDVLCESISL